MTVDVRRPGLRSPRHHRAAERGARRPCGCRELGQVTRPARTRVRGRRAGLVAVAGRLVCRRSTTTRQARDGGSRLRSTSGATPTPPQSRVLRPRRRARSTERHRDHHGIPGVARCSVDPRDCPGLEVDSWKTHPAERLVLACSCGDPQQQGWRRVERDWIARKCMHSDRRTRHYVEMQRIRRSPSPPL